MVHQEFGRRLLDRIADELQETAMIERNALVEGRNMTMILSPLRGKHPKGADNNKRPAATTEPAPAATATTTEPAATAAPTEAAAAAPAASGEVSDAQDSNA